MIGHFVEKVDHGQDRRLHISVNFELFVSVILEPLFVQLPVLLCRFDEFIARHVDCLKTACYIRLILSG